MRKNLKWVCIGLALLMGCSVPEANTQSEYLFFPLETGHFIEYKVEETTYSVGREPVLSNYFLKEIIGAAFRGVTGQVQYPIKRFRRNSSQEGWAMDSIWTAYLLPDRAVKVENNRPYIKLIFPLLDGTSWNGNLFTTLPPQIYKVHFPKTAIRINQVVFEKGLDVIQQYDSSLVSLEKKVERYVKDVGLVYKENTSFTYCQSQACLGKGKVEAGNQKILYIVGYGIE